MQKEIQLGFWGDSTPGNSGEGRLLISDQSKVIESTTAGPMIIPKEQLGFADERIWQEISRLWAVKEGKVIRVPKKGKSYLVDAFLEQDAILQRSRRKNYPKRFYYYTRVPMWVMSAEDHERWEVKQGQTVDAYNRQNKISKKLMQNNIDRLRSNTKIA